MRLESSRAGMSGTLLRALNPRSRTTHSPRQPAPAPLPSRLILPEARRASSLKERMSRVKSTGNLDVGPPMTPTKGQFEWNDGGDEGGPLFMRSLSDLPSE